MRTFEKKIMFLCYRAFAAWLPASRRCKIAKKLRGFFAKRILSGCGDNVMMAPEAVCFTPNHRHDMIDIPMGHQGNEKKKPVVIGNDVWVGRRAMIMTGAHIGNGVILGAGGRQ